jgi:hypothetical protein
MSLRKVQENSEELEMNGTHSVLVYADDNNLNSEDINTTKTALLNASMQTGQQANSEKTACYMCMSEHKCAG